MTEDQRASATRCLNRAMETLKANQSPDGSMARNMEMARRPGQESGVTALAGMAFFLHGGSNVESPYHAPLMKCLDYVLDCQAPGGWFHQSSDGKPGSLYHHAIATWFLAHLKEPLKEDNRSDPINKALTLGVDQLVKAQKIPKPKINRGGWRYTAESRDGDLSCTAWALRALVAARKAGIDVPARTLTDASVYVRSLQTPDGSFAYTAGGQGMPTNVPRAAMGLYCLQSVGQGRTEAADQAAAYILRESSQPQTAYEFYGILWSANAMGRRGGNDRSQYAQWMVPHLEHSQRPDGTWNSQNGALLGALFGALAYLPPEAVVPDIKSQLERDQAIKTMMANGRQIVTAIKLWGGDFSGNYPTAQNDANEALRKLFPIYMDEETIFHLPGSLFCSPAAPDERFQKAEEALRPGENGWAYVSGHTDTDRSTLPVLALGFTANGNQYDHQHLLWKEKKTIVIYLDGKVELKDLHPVGDGDTWELRGSGPHANRNLFDPGLLEGGRLLNPMKPQRALPRKDRPEERRQKDISRQVDDQI
ncbi:MAG: prenyltransferase/squalene oxidase repeat-containing protein [Verrucomicrobiota bacterium]